MQIPNLELSHTVDAMNSADYKDRFLAEYFQTKIRYERLKAMLNKWDAYTDYRFHSSNWDASMKDLRDFLGFVPKCSYKILKEQCDLLGQLLHILEVRAAIEGITLNPEALSHIESNGEQEG